MLIAMAGLPGTGKSALARALAEMLQAVVLDKDIVRAALFPPALVEHSTRQDDFCIGIMLQVSAYLHAKDPQLRVFLDGRPFAQRYQRAQVEEYATAHSIQLRFIECVCTEETARERLQRDSEDGRHLARNRDYALYEALKKRFEPMEEGRLVVDTDDDFQTCVQRCLRYITD